MVRCYLSHDQVVGFRHQWPRGLLDAEDVRAAPASTPMVGSDAPAHQRLRDHVEREWVPRMISILSIDRDSLPVIWDADFLDGPKTPSGRARTFCARSTSAPSGHFRRWRRTPSRPRRLHERGHSDAVATP
jgi:hypothetical protein